MSEPSRTQAITKCEWCSSDLADSRAGARFCGDTCRKAASRAKRRIDLRRRWDCHACGEPLPDYVVMHDGRLVRRLESGRQRRIDSNYCSNACRQAAYRQELERSQAAEFIMLAQSGRIR